MLLRIEHWFSEYFITTQHGEVMFSCYFKKLIFTGCFSLEISEIKAQKFIATVMLIRQVGAMQFDGFNCVGISCNNGF